MIFRSVSPQDADVKGGYQRGDPRMLEQQLKALVTTRGADHLSLEIGAEASVRPRVAEKGGRSGRRLWTRCLVAGAFAFGFYISRQKRWSGIATPVRCAGLRSIPSGRQRQKLEGTQDETEMHGSVILLSLPPLLCLGELSSFLSSALKARK